MKEDFGVKAGYDPDITPGPVSYPERKNNQATPI